MQSIDFQGMTFIPDAPLSTASPDELETVEARLGFTFPEDYQAFVSILGFGETEFHVQALPPTDYYLSESRIRLAECWFWDKSPDILTQARAIDCVQFFGSADGDTILFHPSDRNCWFVLPYEEEEIVVVHSFQELCRLYLQLYKEIQAPYKFHVWSDIELESVSYR